MREEKETGRRRRRLLYGLGLLMAFMLLFTVIARAASAFTTARVTTETPRSRMLDHVVSASGVAEKNRELAVLAQENLMVETIYVNQGESVTAGTLLARLSMDSVQEELIRQEEELALLQLQLSSARENEDVLARQRKLTLDRATEDYQRIQREQEEAVEAARSRYQAAADALAQCRERMQEETGGGAQAGPENPEAGAGQSAGEGAQAGPENSEAGAGQPAGEGTHASPEEGNTEPKEDLKAELERLERELQEAEVTYQAARQNKSDACRSAARTLEDARQEGAADYSARMAEISIAQKERILEELKQVQESQGQILAPVDGVITQVHLAVGQRTTDTAAFTMADLSSGLKFAAEIEKEDAAYVSVGDPVTLKAAGKEHTDLTVFSMEETEEEKILVTVMAPQGVISMGEYAQMEVVKRSREYPSTLPLTAIRTENGKKYVYVVEEEETVLGTELTARSVEVEVLEQNDRYAAIAEGLVGSETPVIISSDSFVSAGDTIRLQEE